MADPRGRILIVDDEPIKRAVMEDELQNAGYTVTTATSPLDVEPIIDKVEFDVVLTDLRMPGQDGLSFLRDLKERNPEQPVIVMTAFGTVETAVEAMKLGAFDYLKKPFSTEELLLKLDRLLQHQDLARENEDLRRRLSARGEETRIVGQSSAIRQVLDRIHAVASTDVSILIEGESGTGKELVARTIHETSVRASGPFIAVSCAALPRELIEAELFGHESGAFTGADRRRLGRFELAHGGTLFLDDVDDIPIELQVKLVRVLQEFAFERIGGEKPIRVNVRVVAATKENLTAQVAAGKFRQDLYYRLNVVPVYMPPLRERPEDVPLLVNYFLQRAALKLNRGELQISEGGRARLQDYTWPGNVRELEHVVERMVALARGAELTEDDVPALTEPVDAKSIVSMQLDRADRVDLAVVLAEVEGRIMRWALSRAGGNLAQAADLLSVPRSTLQYKLSKLESSAT